MVVGRSGHGGCGRFYYGRHNVQVLVCLVIVIVVVLGGACHLLNFFFS